MAGGNMRTIKFRVYDEKYHRFDGSHPFLLYPFESVCKQGRIVQQYIGIKDKNGKDIYEGDLINFRVKGIVHGPDSEFIERAEVWYSEEDLQFVFGKYENLNIGYKYWYSMLDNIDKNTIEVVGNIFQ